MWGCRKYLRRWDELGGSSQAWGNRLCNEGVDIDGICALHWRTLFHGSYASSLSNSVSQLQTNKVNKSVYNSLSSGRTCIYPMCLLLAVGFMRPLNPCVCVMSHRDSVLWWSSWAHKPLIFLLFRCVVVVISLPIYMHPVYTAFLSVWRIFFHCSTCLSLSKPYS